jgi:uncharacterized protein (DUF924 family)
MLPILWRSTMQRRRWRRGIWIRIEQGLRLFFCLPFAHSENPADQDVSVALHRKLGEPWLSHAQGHREIIGRFVRFPHHNAIRGRADMPEEVAFLCHGRF